MKGAIAYRIFSELFLYLKQYQPPHPWRVVVIYPRRSVERENNVHFQGLLTSQQVTRIYLDELEETENSPLGVRLVKLITAKETEASPKAQMLLESVSREVEETKLRNDIIDVMESIMVYKFPQMSRKEIAGMLGVDDKQANTVLSRSVYGREAGGQTGRKTGGQTGREIRGSGKNARFRFRFRNDAYGSVCDLRASNRFTH